MFWMVKPRKDALDDCKNYCQEILNERFENVSVYLKINTWIKKKKLDESQMEKLGEREIDEKSCRTERRRQKGNENACLGGVNSCKATNGFSLNWRRWQACEKRKWKRKVTRRHIKHGVGCKCEAEEKGRKKWKALRLCSDFINVVQSIIEDEVWGVDQATLAWNVLRRHCILNCVISCIGLLFLMVLRLFPSHGLLHLCYFCADCTL